MVRNYHAFIQSCLILSFSSTATEPRGNMFIRVSNALHASYLLLNTCFSRTCRAYQVCLFGSGACSSLKCYFQFLDEIHRHLYRTQKMRSPQAREFVADMRERILRWQDEASPEVMLDLNITVVYPPPPHIMQLKYVYSSSFRTKLLNHLIQSIDSAHLDSSLSSVFLFFPQC